MAPLVADGIYKILNVQYPRSAVDLIYANPNGAIAGYTDNDNTKNQQWRLRNVGDNRVTLENVAAPGAYANAPIQLHGSPLSGSANATKWILSRVDQNRYQLATPDRKLVWFLPGSFDYLEIDLQPADSSQGKGESSQFTLRPIQ